MIKIITPVAQNHTASDSILDLFSFRCTDGENQITHAPYTNLNISTSQHARNNRDGTLVPIQREVIRVVGVNKAQISTETPGDEIPNKLTEFPTSLKVYDDDRGITRIQSRILDYNSRSNLFLVAMPFSGILSIEENRCYRIYKAMIVTSSIPCTIFNTRKIMYMVIEPNLRLFDENHSHHTDKISINIVANRTRPDEPLKSSQIYMDVDILNADGDVDVKYGIRDVELEEPLKIDSAKLPWTIFKFDKKSADSDGYARRDRKQFNRPRIEQHGEEIVRVDSNKHGIRRENTIRRPNGFRRDNHRRNDNASIDDMIAKSGIHDNDGLDKYGRKRSGPKKRRR